MTESPVVYLAFANDTDEHLELLKSESRDVNRALRDLDAKGVIKVYRDESAETQDVFDAFTGYQNQIAIFHYGGHAGGTKLRLEGGEGDARGLSALMAEQENLKLVFLNGCSTRGQVETMMAAGVKAVIATSVPIQDRTAQEFAVQFYNALAKHHTIGQSFRLAESFLKAQHGSTAEIGVVEFRGERESAPETDELPWGLYVKPEFRSDVLDWKLPYSRAVGLPKEVVRYLGQSFTANPYIVLVLDEMAKYNRDIYEKMVDRNGDRVSEIDSREYPELIIKNFPWPIGSQVRLLFQSEHKNPDAMRLKQLVSTYVLTSQLLYYIMLSDLWENVSHGTITLPEGFRLQQPASQAEYLAFDFLGGVSPLHEPFVKAEVAPFLPEFALVCQELNNPDSPLRKAQRILEDLRSRLPADAPTADLPKICNLAERAVSVVLKAAAFLSQYSMLTVRTVSVVAPRLELPKFDMNMGPLNASEDAHLGMYQDEPHRTKSRFGCSHSIVIVNDEDDLDNSLNLSPFVVDKNTFVRLEKGGSPTAHIFVLAYKDADRLAYLDIKHNLYVALEHEEDWIRTHMTESDFTEGRNLNSISVDGFDIEAALDDLDVLGDDLSDLGIETAGPRVFALLDQQYQSFAADLAVATT